MSDAPLKLTAALTIYQSRIAIVGLLQTDLRKCGLMVDIDNQISLPEPLYEHDKHVIITMKDHLYSISGITTRKVERLALDCDDKQLRNSTWEPVGSLFEPRSEFMASVLHNSIYIAGGCSGSKMSLTNTVEKFEDQLGWSLLQLALPKCIKNGFMLLKDPDSVMIFAGKLGIRDNNTHLVQLNSGQVDLEVDVCIHMPSVSIGRVPAIVNDICYVIANDLSVICYDLTWKTSGFKLPIINA